jgi:hypothetical protein
MIRKGQAVAIRPQWRDPGDENVQFVALEDEDGGRVLIGALEDVLYELTPVSDDTRSYGPQGRR